MTVTPTKKPSPTLFKAAAAASSSTPKMTKQLFSQAKLLLACESGDPDKCKEALKEFNDAGYSIDWSCNTEFNPYFHTIAKCPSLEKSIPIIELLNDAGGPGLSSDETTAAIKQYEATYGTYTPEWLNLFDVIEQPYKGYTAYQIHDGSQYNCCFADGTGCFKNIRPQTNNLVVSDYSVNTYRGQNRHLYLKSFRSPNPSLYLLKKDIGVPEPVETLFGQKVVYTYNENGRNNAQLRITRPRQAGWMPLHISREQILAKDGTLAEKIACEKILAYCQKAQERAKENVLSLAVQPLKAAAAAP